VLNLTSTSDLIRVVTSAAGAIDVHASWADYLSPQTVTPGRTNTASITTATTTTVVPSPAASTVRNVKHLSLFNEHVSVTNVVTVEHFDGSTAETLWKGTLLAGELAVCDANGLWTVYSVAGVAKKDTGATLFNYSTVAQGPGFAADTYLTGSFILFPSGGPKVGTSYKCRFSASKTTAGTATPIVQVRTGTLGTTGDTSRCSFTLSAGTAATDVGLWFVEVVFRSVGAGTSAVAQGSLALTSQATTGFSSLLKGVQTTSGGFDSTTAGLGIGVSVNGGTSAAWTVQQVVAELKNF
jgi:hypothetical protein